MDVEGHNVFVSDAPSSKAIRRFWMAWLILLIALLAGLILIILIATLVADPGRVSPAG